MGVPTVSTADREPFVSSSSTTSPKLKMENNEGVMVDLYVPRKCSATGRLMGAKDHASVQINIGDVNEEGVYTGTNKTYALSGFVRNFGESDDSLNRLASKDGYMKNVWSFQK